MNAVAFSEDNYTFIHLRNMPFEEEEAVKLNNSIRVLLEMMHAKKIGYTAVHQGKQNPSNAVS